MTRDEAKEALSVLKIYDAQWLREAIDMAIEALSEVRCNDCKWNDDVIEVVRCKDCKWYYVINPKVERGLCEFEARPRSRKARSDSDFCSYGERRESLNE